MSRLTLLRCQSGGAAAEFALTLPLMLLLTLGMIDVGRLMYVVNRAEKATQIGVRMAIVTDPLSPALIEADYASPALPSGSLIPADQLGKITCTNSGCSCADDPCPEGAAVDAEAHALLVARMDDILEGVGATNVQVSYSGSGFGFAGSTVTTGGGGGAPETMEISPLVTVSLTGLEFAPIFLAGMIDFGLPAFSSTLPAEDASGQVSH